MLGTRDQLDRWRKLLQTPPDAPTGRPADEEARLVRTVSAARGRPFVVGVLEAIEAGVRDENIRAAVGTRLRPLDPIPTRRPAAEGVAVADAVWNAYLHWQFGVPDAADWLRGFIASLAPTALVFTANDNPEPWWQNEMVILHAVHSFALRSHPVNTAVLEQTLACADFHLREIQPDHATNEPWAVHAYASHADGNVTAETLLHAGFIQHGGALGPVARLVARDAGGALAAYLDR